MTMPKQLILQFRVDAHGSTKDLDRLIEIECNLDAALQRNGEGSVDGHDMGSGEMNLFIIVETWKRGVWFMEQYLKNQPWGKDCVLAKDNRDGSYEVLWPKNFTGAFQVT
jgi:hypothetical protein